MVMMLYWRIILCLIIGMSMDYNRSVCQLMSMQKDNVIYDKHANDSNAHKDKYLLYAAFKSLFHLSQRKEHFIVF